MIPIAIVQYKTFGRVERPGRPTRYNRPRL